MRRLFYSLILLAVLVMGVPALAQTDRPDTYIPITYGDTVTSELSDATPVDAYIFDGQAGDIVSIAMTADDSTLDPRIYLFTQSNYESGAVAIAEDDDGGSGLNSLLDGFVLPESGAYIIEATRFGGEGTYELTFTLDGTGPAPVAGEALSYGDTVTGEITESDPEVIYTFTGSAEDVVSISMTADDTTMLDTVLQLYTQSAFASGDTTLAENDDFDGLNSRIDAFALPEDGTYVIVATRLGGEGTYELTLEAEGMGDMTGAQSVILGDGESAVSVMVPATWQTTFQTPFTVLAESQGGIDVFTANDIVAAPEGEITIAIASPEGASEGIREIAGGVEVEETTAAYLATASTIFGVSEDLIEPYDGFAVPASGVVFPEDVEAPPNTVMFVLDLEEGFTWVLVVTGGAPADFEAEIVEIINSMAGIEPSFAQEMDAMDGEMQAVDIGDGLSVSVPASWATGSEAPLIFAGSSEAALEVFTGNEVVNAPDGEVVISFVGPSQLAEIGGELAEQTTATYQELIATSVFGAPDEVVSYDGFDFPASGVILDNAPEAPANSTSFVIETDAGFVWIVVVTGGNPAEFEAQVVEIVNSLGQ